MGGVSYRHWSRATVYYNSIGEDTIRVITTTLSRGTEPASALDHLCYRPSAKDSKTTSAIVSLWCSQTHVSGDLVVLLELAVMGGDLVGS